MAEIEALLRAAEPAGTRPLGELVGRLEAEGRLRVLRSGGRSARLREIAAVPIRAVTYDSRLVVDGGLFVAVPGAHTDGHQHAPEAVARGAAALVVERPLPELAIPQLVVVRSQGALSTVACWWYRDPSLDLGVVGVTGTDGKTTTAAMALAVLEASHIQTGLLSTADVQIGGRRIPNPTHSTTPEAPELERSLRAMHLAGDKVAIVETTSHGLALERVGGIAYDVAVLTNVTHEHLELHGTFDAYRAAKASLFEGLAAGAHNPPKGPPGRSPWPKTGIVNLDDASAETFMAATRAAGARLVTYGTAAAADVRAVGVGEDARRLTVDVVAPRWHGRLELRMAGRFNAHNALAAVALGEALELDPDAVRQALATFAGVAGRMERVDAGQPFTVIIDYAHTPASLETVLDVLAPVAAARGGTLLAVFGSAGERDLAKRPLMGRIAGERCRLVVATDEDPRGEDRLAILEEIALGAEAAGRRRGRDLLLIPDRATAIATAFERARPGDVVLLAGKGHERSIISGPSSMPWNEREVALEALAALGHSRASAGRPGR